MAVSRTTAISILDRLLQGSTPESELGRLLPRLPSTDPLKPRISGGAEFTREAMEGRRKLLESQGIEIRCLAGNGVDLAPEELAGNIEDFIGFAKIPVGVIGPLRINGAYAHDDFYVPMATHEGALVASYQRGAYAISLSGGASVLCLTESVGRAPCFVFRSLVESSRFLAWILPRVDGFQSTVVGTSRHCRMIDVRPSVTGKDVYLNFEYFTGDAAGQNMVTLATQAVCERIVAESPVKPVRWYVEGNLSGDKKATMLSFMYARGKKVVAECTIPAKILRRLLHVSAEEVMDYWHISFLGGAQSGSIGVQGHFANALAALFIATGQDAACVSEASVGLTRLDAMPGGALYASVSLPNVIVGTVGGGTRLPTAEECLRMIGCDGEGKARKLAEICAATALAGEISIIAALTAGHFAQAHAKFGRRHSSSKT